MRNNKNVEVHTQKRNSNEDSRHLLLGINKNSDNCLKKDVCCNTKLTGFL